MEAIFSYWTEVVGAHSMMYSWTLTDGRYWVLCVSLNHVNHNQQNTWKGPRLFLHHPLAIKVLNKKHCIYRCNANSTAEPFMFSTLYSNSLLWYNYGLWLNYFCQLPVLKIINQTSYRPYCKNTGCLRHLHDQSITLLCLPQFHLSDNFFHLFS